VSAGAGGRLRAGRRGGLKGGVMPFVAKHRDTNERVDITQIQNPRGVLEKGKYICQLCDGDFVIKAGLIKAAHFAHKVICLSDWNYHPESIEHLIAKREIAIYLRSRPDYNIEGIHIELEVPIPEIKRQADILTTFPTGWKIAHEVQLSAITIEDLEERTNDYGKLGIETYWWLGKKAATDTNLDWCVNNCGGCIRIDFKRIVKETTILPSPE